MKKFRKNLCRFVCLLICMITLAGYFPAQEADAGAGDLSVYWNWVRADTITDYSYANLSQYTRALIMYKDETYEDGTIYVMGTDTRTESKNLIGYHSYHYQGTGTYTTTYNVTTHRYLQAGKSANGNHIEKSTPNWTDYGRDPSRYCLVSKTLADAQMLVNENISFSESFVTLEDISCYKIEIQEGSYNNGNVKEFNFKLYQMKDGAEYEIAANESWQDALSTDGNWGKYSVSNVWLYSTWADGGAGNIRTDFAETGGDGKAVKGMENFEPFWNFRKNDVFVERFDAVYDNIYSWANKFYIYLGSPSEFTCLNDYTVKTGSVVNIAKGEAAFVMDKLTIEPGGVLTVDGVLVNNGVIWNYGTVMIRSGGTISTPIFSADGSGGYFYCCGGGATYGSSQGEGGLIIESGGRLVLNSCLCLYGGCSVMNNGEMILPRGIWCIGTESDFTLQRNGYIWLGYEFTNTGDGMIGKLKLVQNWNTHKIYVRTELVSVHFYKHLTLKNEDVMFSIASSTEWAYKLNVRYEEDLETYKSYKSKLGADYNESNPDYAAMYQKFRIYSSSNKYKF